MRETYKREWEWSGYTVTRTKAGWVVDNWSRVQGDNTYRRVLIKPRANLSHDVDLDTPWNAEMDNGQYIAEVLTECPDKVLRTGWVVE